MNKLTREAAQTWWFYGLLHFRKYARQLLKCHLQLVEAVWKYALYFREIVYLRHHWKLVYVETLFLEEE